MRAAFVALVVAALASAQESRPQKWDSDSRRVVQPESRRSKEEMEAAESRVVARLRDKKARETEAKAREAQDLADRLRREEMARRPVMAGDRRRVNDAGFRSFTSWTECDNYMEFVNAKDFEGSSRYALAVGAKNHPIGTRFVVLETLRENAKVRLHTDGPDVVILWVPTHHLRVACEVTETAR